MFKKWDIVYISRFPETIQCSNLKCCRHFSIVDQNCPHCNSKNNVSSVIGKPRPIILWLDKIFWSQSMAFGIPLSKTNMYSDKFNQIIKLPEYQFTHNDLNYKIPMRAVICQSTRIDGNVLQKGSIIGRITDSVLQKNIENKLLNWIFPS